MNGHLKYMAGWGMVFLFTCCYESANTQTGQLPVVECCAWQSSHLVFEDDIIYADVGDSEHFIFGYTNNILRLKGQAVGHPTNLTVITAGEDYYSFRLRYDSMPGVNYFITRGMCTRHLGNREELYALQSRAHNVEEKETMPPDTGSGSGLTDRERMVKVKGKANKNNIRGTPATDSRIIPQGLYRQACVLRKKEKLYDHIGTRHADIRLKVTGVYHGAANCFIVYTVQNRGVIPYDISYVEFGVEDQRRPKQSAVSETVLHPVFILGQENGRVEGKRLNAYVAVFEKLAVPKGKVVYRLYLSKGEKYPTDLL